MDFKKTITLLAVICAFSSFGQELIAPYNMMKGNNVDVIDTVPVDEIWKVESIALTGEYSDRQAFYINDQRLQVRYQGFSTIKFPFWLDSGETIRLPYLSLKNNQGSHNYVGMISILRFTKPD
ncbi:hypothetical protein N9N66_04105 [Schleiferiaceae bacterium]|nr:hypothetical protein [Schleiferiaceae bacterium]